MTIPPNGITADRVGDIMPPCHRNHSLLAAAIATLPPPRPAAADAGRSDRLTCLLQDIAACPLADGTRPASPPGSSSPASSPT